MNEQLKNGREGGAKNKESFSQLILIIGDKGDHLNPQLGKWCTITTA